MFRRWTQNRVIVENAIHVQSSTLQANHITTYTSMCSNKLQTRSLKVVFFEFIKTLNLWVLGVCLYTFIIQPLAILKHFSYKGFVCSTYSFQFEVLKSWFLMWRDINFLFLCLATSFFGSSQWCLWQRRDRRENIAAGDEGKMGEGRWRWDLEIMRKWRGNKNRVTFKHCW